jgi:hypothetical protein
LGVALDMIRTANAIRTLAYMFLQHTQNEEALDNLCLEMMIAERPVCLSKEPSRP